MGRNIDEVIAALPKQRKNRIEKRAREMAGAMIAHADSLAAIRKAFSKTQSEMGRELGLPQNAVSQLEKRSDMRVSTLIRYVDALGAELDLVVRLKDGSEIVVLKSLGETVKRSQRKKTEVRKKSSERIARARPARDTALSRR